MQKIKQEEIQHWTAIRIEKKELKKNMKSNRMILTLIQDKNPIEYNSNQKQTLKAKIEKKNQIYIRSQNVRHRWPVYEVKCPCSRGWK